MFEPQLYGHEQIRIAPGYTMIPSYLQKMYKTLQ